MNKVALLIGAAVLAAFTGFALLADDGTSPSTVHADQFDAFTLKFRKNYASMSDRALRFRIFQENFDLITAHNQKPSSYTLGINEFADLTFEEFSAKYLSHVAPAPETDKICQEARPSTSSYRPDGVNWHKAGKVQKVKNQAACGSCWAFSAIGAVESALAIKNNGDIPNLSEQELVDCSGEYGNYGCNGGLMHFAFNYIFENKINSDADYAYTAHDDECRVPEIGHGKTEIKGCVKAEPSIDGLADALTVGPVSVAFAVQNDFRFYKSGIYNPASCPGQINHGVLAYGYCQKCEIPHYSVKNSWGESWGAQGHFKIAFGTGRGTCSIAGNGYNYYPTV